MYPIIWLPIQTLMCLFYAYLLYNSLSTFWPFDPYANRIYGCITKTLSIMMFKMANLDSKVSDLLILISEIIRNSLGQSKKMSWFIDNVALNWFQIMFQELQIFSLIVWTSETDTSFRGFNMSRNLSISCWTNCLFFC